MLTQARFLIGSAGTLIVAYLGWQAIGYIWSDPRGLIIVDSPEVYTRERLVNDRFSQTAWLLRQLRVTENSRDDALFEALNGYHQRYTERIVQAALGNNNGEPEKDNSGKGVEPISPTPSPQLTTTERFRSMNEYRQEVRTELLQTDLDDRHDIEGNTLYHLTFETVLLPPARNPDAVAVIEVRLRQSQPPDRQVFNEWINYLNEEYEKYLRNRTTLFTGNIDFEAPAWREAIDSLVEFTIADQAHRGQMDAATLRHAVEQKARNNREAVPVNGSEVYTPFPLAKLNSLLAASEAEEITPEADKPDIQHKNSKKAGNHYWRMLARFEGCSLLNKYPIVSDLLEFSLKGCGSMYCDLHMREKGTEFPVGHEKLECPPSYTPSTLDAHANIAGSPLVANDTREPPTAQNLFSAYLQRSIDGFSYGVIPKISAKRVSSTETDRQLISLATQLSHSGWLSRVGSSAIDSLSTAVVSELPLVVGFGAPFKYGNDGESSAVGARFGWIVRPILTHASIDQRMAERYTLASVVSLPSWWRKLEAEVSTCWVHQSSRISTKEKWLCANGAKTSLPDNIPIPGDVKEINRKLGIRVIKSPWVDNVSSLRRQWLEIGRPGRLTIEGGRLWRSTRVLAGTQSASEITVLPNMGGIIATFDCVERPTSDVTYKSRKMPPMNPSAQPADTSTPSSAHGREAQIPAPLNEYPVVYQVELRVWTSEGSTTPIPIDVVEQNSSAQQSDCTEKGPTDDALIVKQLIGDAFAGKPTAVSEMKTLRKLKPHMRDKIDEFLKSLTTQFDTK